MNIFQYQIILANNKLLEAINWLTEVKTLQISALCSSEVLHKKNLTLPANISNKHKDNKTPQFPNCPNDDVFFFIALIHRANLTMPCYTSTMQTLQKFNAKVLHTIVLFSNSKSSQQTNTHFCCTQFFFQTFFSTIIIIIIIRSIAIAFTCVVDYIKIIFITQTFPIKLNNCNWYLMVSLRAHKLATIMLARFDG